MSLAETSVDGPTIGWAARLRIIAVLLVLVPVTLVMLPYQLLAIRLGWRATMVPILFHRTAIRLLGVRGHCVGAPAATKPLLLCCNHVSWLDIDVLGSLFPLSFIAKSDVAGWPIFGLFAKLQRTIFVDRNRRHATGAVTSEIAARLDAGDTLVLFAEGTSSDGNRVLPFRTSLFGAAKEGLSDASKRVTLQPVAICYRGYRGLPMTRTRRPLYAWYGDMDLAPHLLAVMADGAIDIEVRFGEPVTVDERFDRKAVARRMEEEVRAMLADALHGRTPRRPTAA